MNVVLAIVVLTACHVLYEKVLNAGGQSWGMLA